MPRRADPRIAIFAGSELVRPDPSTNALLALDMIEAETIRQGEVAGCHGLVDSDGDDCARSLRRQPRLSSIDNADPCRVPRETRSAMSASSAGRGFSAEGIELAEKLRNAELHVHPN